MNQFGKKTLLGLLEMYETAIADLERTRDQSVSGLIGRMEKHRAEIIAALEHMPG